RRAYRPRLRHGQPAPTGALDGPRVGAVLPLLSVSTDARRPRDARPLGLLRGLAEGPARRPFSRALPPLDRTRLPPRKPQPRGMALQPLPAQGREPARALEVFPLSASPGCRTSRALRPGRPAGTRPGVDRRSALACGGPVTDSSRFNRTTTSDES